MRYLKFIAVVASVLASALYAEAQEGDSILREYLPEINGTIRAKYEYQPQEGNGRFQVRTARLSASGDILPILSYKAEIDLCDEGKIKMLDAYGRFNFAKQGIAVTMGQMRVPFTIDAHRSPHQQYFANRSFIAKQAGNVRDVGLAVAYGINGNIPTKIEGGVFSGSGLTNQKDYWTGTYNFSFKVQSTFFRHLTLQASCQRATPGDVNVMMWDAGAFFDNGLWHVEGEYLRKNYAHKAFAGVNAVDAFVVRNFPMDKTLSCVSALLRYDYLSDHSNGIKNEDGVLQADDPERHRITAGVTFRFGKESRWADVRLNYEKYFYRDDAAIGPSGHDKLVVEMMVRF